MTQNPRQVKSSLKQAGDLSETITLRDPDRAGLPVLWVTDDGEGQLWKNIQFRRNRNATGLVYSVEADCCFQ